MNAIQIRLRVDELIDRTRTARHTDSEYYNAINGATAELIKDRVEAIRPPKRYSVQSSQRLRSELYTLIPAPWAGSTFATNVVTFPTDYYYYLVLYISTGSTPKTSCTPTTYDEVGLLSINPFKKPSAIKPYFNERASGLQVECGGLTSFTYELWYIKIPQTVTIGFERDKITSGGAIGNGTDYYVYEDCVYNSNTYYAGEKFTGGATATLTSGIVIPASIVVNSDLPANLHEELCVMTAKKLSLTVENYNKEQRLATEAGTN